jgi:hypothetical protein
MSGKAGAAPNPARLRNAKRDASAVNGLPKANVKARWPIKEKTPLTI